MVDHHRVRVLDPADEFRLAPGIEGDDLRMPLEHSTLVVEGFGDEVGDDDFGE